MSAIPGLKKKLKSVRATGKLSKALKTVSAAKFSRIAALRKNYSHYEEQYRRLLGSSFSENADAGNEPETWVLFGSNRGFCGGFNGGVIDCYGRTVSPEKEPAHLIVCGEELARVFSEIGYEPERVFSFGDVPAFEECEQLFSYLSSIAGEEKNYPVRLIRPFYINTMTQTAEAETICLNPTAETSDESGILWIPDRETVLGEILRRGIRALLYGAVLETALGAQAATLVTMRSAFDTATEYSETLEGEIHRLRQSEVTADVIETASERGSKGDEFNG